MAEVQLLEANVHSARQRRDIDTVSCDNVADLLEVARAAYGRNDVDAGWMAYHNAKERAVDLLDDSGLVALAEQLLHEADTEQIPSGCRDALTHLLGAAPCLDDRPRSLNRERVRAALQVRDLYFRYVYYALRVTSQRRIALITIGLGVGVGLGLLFALGPVDWMGTLAGHPDLALLAIVLAGVLGAVTSAVQRLARDPIPGGIPARLGSFTAVVTRVFVGGVAGLTTALAAASVVEDTQTLGPLMLAGFAAGWAERLATTEPTN